MKGLNIESIRAQDKSDMLSLLLGFPEQVEDAQEIGKKIVILNKRYVDFNKIVFTGVGGSAIGADLVRSYVLDECRVPIFVNRDYTLPAFIDNDTLLIVSSYSGNTEETLSAYKEGLKKKAKIVVITSGGRLKDLAEGDGLLSISIPQGLPPRCALGYSSIPMICLFSKLRLIRNKDNQIKEASRVLERLRDKVLCPDIADGKNTAKYIARSIVNKYAVIYGANQHIDSVVTRWRGQLAENAKTVSSSHIFPEMNHNEIVGWLNPRNLMKDLTVILLRDKGDHPRVKKRMDISKTIIENSGVEVIEVASQGDALLSRIFSLVYIGDFVSFYLAILNGIDPTPVDNVTYLKKELART